MWRSYYHCHPLVKEKSTWDNSRPWGTLYSKTHYSRLHREENSLPKDFNPIGSQDLSLRLIQQEARGYLSGPRQTSYLLSCVSPPNFQPITTSSSLTYSEEICLVVLLPASKKFFPFLWLLLLCFQPSNEVLQNCFNGLVSPGISGGSATTKDYSTRTTINLLVRYVGG